jgi:outer membrane protein TolC
LKQNRWEADYKRADIGARIKSHINEWVSYRTQFELYGQNILNYEKLWRSERRLFDNGESTLFMINAREISYMNARLKGNELLFKSYKSAIDLQQASGKFMY